MVVLAYDVESNRDFGIPGEGNVALDVTQILLWPPKELATTGIATHALDALRESSIRKVYLMGRRGPVQASCTAKELREILGNCYRSRALFLYYIGFLNAAIKDLHINIKEADLLKTSGNEEEIKNNRIRRRVFELLSKASSSAAPHPSLGQRELHFTFFRKPEKFLESEKQYCWLNLVGSAGSGNQIASGTSLVLKSIGYKSVPVDGLPFNYSKGVVPNIGGGVVSSSDDAQTEDGLYLASISEDIAKKELTSTSLKPGRVSY
uniref:NADPH:adrenodoxin oxidoreductase, mitochondrial isoform X1 n=1 Tax=Tanacetum cinerariifolium TaxID=118510 RepID=A0A6L2JKY0_TANCI|nr:NADPH:adrenodoxin oxidoreductase, mitochondrial isoform X1 [Tanacetum cinerariifolium]